MDAKIGDQVAVIFNENGRRERAATVIDIRDAAGNETYLVEWSDNGHRQLVELGPGSVIEQR